MAFLSALMPAIGSAVAGAVASHALAGASGQNQAQLTPASTLGATNADQLGNAYNQAQTGLQGQVGLVNQLQGMDSTANQRNLYAQQQQLADLLGQQANGQGPNPAMAQLAQSTGANVANQAALMASQRGSGANVGLLARQAAMQGAGLQQQGAGQAATLAAQQQMAARQLQMQQQQSMGQQNQQQIAQLAQAIQGQGNMALQGQQNLLGAAGAQNMGNISQANNMNNLNANIGQTNAANLQGQARSIGSTLMPAISTMFSKQPVNQLAGNDIFGNSGGSSANTPAALPDNNFTINAAHGGMIDDGPASNVGKYLCASKGAVVPGKAKRSGDHLANDTVPAMLSPKEIVLPRSVTLSKNAPEQAARFVAAILAKQGRK